MDRAEYTECMTPHMQGKGKSKEERLRDMCVGAKLCSGKASTREEAEKICLAEPPREAKPKKTRVSKTLNVSSLVGCAVSKIDFNTITTENFENILASAIHECLSVSALSQYKKFYRSCMQEHSTGDIRKLQAEKRFCDELWKKEGGGG